ncbi:MAG: molybdopterin-dependent oxidoreductase [Sulfurospirillaceae bacterium]|nr:molybdopterin-dependent oxidoreductase [Sulfurospirillaceae bacterium]MDD2827287.1 molybdopterin-dependent oxidoreductase [Sulfurospirillaceae bacterium]
MENSRRNFLIGTGIVAASASIVGYKDTLGAVALLKDKGERAKDSIYFNASAAEFSVKNNTFSPNEHYTMANSTCNGCTTHCGVRVKIEKESGKVVRVFGNPFHPLSSDPWLPYATSIEQSFTFLTQTQHEPNAYRSSMCARGNVAFDKLNDAFRVLKPLKRVGKRGENKWVEIDIEQLLDEVVKGGNLFGEGDVEGLAATRDLETLINPDEPSFGSRANGLCIIGTADEGRQNFIVPRFVQSYGTVNFMGHTSICGLSMRAGEAAYLGDFKKSPHLKPDFEHCEYLLSIGTAPGQAGNPFKRQGKLLSEARTNGRLKYATVLPMQSNADTIAMGDKSSWIPVLPGGDLAFVMGLLQIIIEKDMYNLSYLSIPSEKAKITLKEASWTNATHLVIQDEEGFGTILKEGEMILVLDSADNQLKNADDVTQGVLEYSGEVILKGKIYTVKTAFTLLRESANDYTLDMYAKESGVSVAKMQEVAHEFCSHGRKVAIDCHGGTMHTTGFYTTYAIMMLGAMVGNLNYKGGMSAGGGKFKDFAGKQYNLLAYKGKPQVKGARIDKARMPYEKTNEFKAKKEAGINPYPAKDAWYPLAAALESDVISNSAHQYPYALKTLISWNANFIYGQSGSEHIKALLQDPKKAIPLFIAIDPFINETSKYADYIVPDSVLFETWGALGVWAGCQTKVSTIRFPIIKPAQATFKNGEPICMDSFLIELGKKLGLPGFGKGAIKGENGENFAFDRPHDFYIRAFENIAMDGTPVPDCSDEEIELSGISAFKPLLQEICKDNWKKTAYVMARGGRYEDKTKSYNGEWLSHPYKGNIHIYNEELGTKKNALNGKRYSGVPKYYMQRTAMGQDFASLYPKAKFPLSAFSYKSNVLSQAMASSSLLKEIHYTTYVDVNPKTAQDFGLKHGDLVKVSSANGEVSGYLRLRNGLYPSTIGIEHGAGREGEGAVDVEINGKVLKGLAMRRSGVNINKLGLLDHSRAATISDFVVGSNARQAIPVAISKIG